jgi:hypothetical protein
VLRKHIPRKHVSRKHIAVVCWTSCWSCCSSQSLNACVRVCLLCVLCRRGQLKALVDIHGADEGLGGTLTEDEIKVICGALDLTNKTARR